VQEANKLAAEARNENTSLKEELKKMKKKMKGSRSRGSRLSSKQTRKRALFANLSKAC
jgi:hypothetical protein